MSLSRADGVVRKYLILGLPDLFYSTPVLHWFNLEIFGNDVQDSWTVCLRNNPPTQSIISCCFLIVEDEQPF